MKEMEESYREEKALYLAVLLNLLEQPRIKLSEVAEKLHVGEDKLRRALEIKEGERFIKIEEVEGETIVSLREDAKDWYFQLSTVWVLEEPEKIEGGSELFKKLMGIKPYEKAVYIHQLDDGKLIFLIRLKTNGSDLFAFLPLRLQQLVFDKDRSGHYEISFAFDDILCRDLEVKDDLLGFSGRWRYQGVSLVEDRRENIRKILASGGFIVYELEGRKGIER
jgi:bifunctional DNA-binding transcriptional regulator/antitoxin component of YhaV-PrlF toxin-antitoxin module